MDGTEDDFLWEDHDGNDDDGDEHDSSASIDKSNDEQRKEGLQQYLYIYAQYNQICCYLYLKYSVSSTAK